MMKIDVEGWENRVLDGASAKLAASDAPLLQVEFTGLDHYPDHPPVSPA